MEKKLSASEKAKIARHLKEVRKARLSKLPVTDGEVRELTEDRETELEARAQEDSIVGVLVQLDEKDQRFIAEIDEALACLDEGTYGICEECEEPIPKERLRAVPSTRLCVDCKRNSERQLGRRSYVPVTHTAVVEIGAVAAED